jgi:intein/homing endonuclease
MIIKQCQFPGQDDQGTYLHLLYPGEQNSHLEKTASIGPPQLEHVRKIIRKTERRDGHVYVLVSALGVGEYWGSNSNGDTFPEEALIHTPPGWNEMSLERQRSIGPGWEWGYPTFYNAHTYSHHQNKSVKRAFGSVYYVMWDNHMKRVLLILDIDRAAAQRMGAQGVVDRIENGEYPEVSMGCSPPGTLILMANGRSANIEDVKEGDFVKTHRGQDGKVAQVYTRRYTGTMYDIKVHGHWRRLRLTDEHPLLVVSSDQLRCRPKYKGHNRCRRMNHCTPATKAFSKGCIGRDIGCETEPSFVPSWVRADELQLEDRLLFPVPSGIDPTLTDPKLVELLGYYLAEGFTHNYNKRENAAITFCLSKAKQKIIDRVIELRDHFDVAAYYVWDGNGSEARHLAIFGCEDLVDLCLTHCGKYSKRKRLSSQIMHMAPELQKIFLAAYWRGDGGYYNGKSSAGLYFSAASEELSDQLFIMLARCGIIASVNRIKHSPSAKSVVKVDTVEFQVWVGKQFVGELASYCDITPPELKKVRSLRFFFEYKGTRYVASPVKEIVGEKYDGPVHNFAVDGDDSYVASHLSVHNCKVLFDLCSICTDWTRALPLLGKPKLLLKEHKKQPIRGVSATRQGYCQHLKFELNRIYPDGRKVQMINMHPRFFDLSFVFIGADKTSKVMAKLAGGLCPIRDNSPMCKGGCYDCAIPSSHVHEVWSRGEQLGDPTEKIAERAQRSGAVVVSTDLQKTALSYARPFDKERWESGKASTVKGLVGRGVPQEWAESHLNRIGQRAEEIDTATKSLMAQNPSLLYAKAYGRVIDPKAKQDVPGMPTLKKQSVAAPGMERGLEDEEFAAAFGIDKQSALDLAKKAEIIKQIRSNFSKALPGMESEEPELPKELIKALAQDLPDALASAGSMGIVAKPKEFQRMILISRGRPQLADDLDEKGICFSPGAPPSSDPMIGQIIPRLLEALAPMLGGRSALAPAIHKRVVRITVVKPPGQSNSVPEDLADNPILSKIGADYSAYRQQLLYKLAALTGQLIHEHPWVLADLYGGLPERSLSGGLVKAGGDVMESLIGMFPIDYLNKVHLDHPVSAYVDDHCDLDGLVIAGELASCGRVA